MTCPVKVAYSPQAFRSAVWKFWKRTLPVELLNAISAPERAVYKPSLGYLSPKVVAAAIHYLRWLTIMGIDKCRPRCLICCPVLFERFYQTTFPVEKDLAHFERIPISVKQYEKWLRRIYVDKKYQRADWSKRPLSEEMLSYAQADVAYLHELMELYESKVLAMGREDMLSSEHTRLESTPASADPYPEENYYRIKGATKLDGVQRRRLREVYGARNAIAAEEDRAPFRLMSNESLIFLSKKPPQNEDEFRRVRGINRHAVTRLVGPVLDALSRASTLDPIERNPSKPKVQLRGVPRDRFERVRKLRARVAKEMGVDGSLLLRKETAVQLAERPPADLEGLSSYLADWQLGLFGVELLEALEG